MVLAPAWSLPVTGAVHSATPSIRHPVNREDSAVRATDMQRDEQAKGVFLPDFCAIRTVFLVVVIAELLAIVIALSGQGTLTQHLDDLALTSLFIQWVVLGSAAVLCWSRPRLIGRSVPVVAMVAWLLVLGVTALVSEVAWWVIGRQVGWLTLGSDSHASFVLRNVAIGAIMSAFLLRYFYVQHQWQRRIVSEARARFDALQARIRPHFLFNCMNTIASLTRIRPQAAERAVEDLADLFRASLADARSHLRIEEELRLCRQYLDIEALRLGDRLKVEWAVDALPSDALLPALTLQPLVENAVYHGIEPLPEGGVVRIAASRDGRQLSIAIDNPQPRLPDRPHHDGNRMAQENVRERLRTFFGESATIDVDAGGDHYGVRLRFPYLQTGDLDDARTDR
jgi:two-component system sensor histidine kinase AlgZ